MKRWSIMGAKSRKKKRENQSQLGRVEEHPPVPPHQQADHTTTITEIQSKRFSGPLPPPEVLAKFEAIQTGLADRIVTMAEGEADHRRSIESRFADTQLADVRAGRTEARLGQVFGLIIGLAAIGAGTYAVIQGHDTAGGVIGAGGVCGLVTAFIIGRKATRSADADAEGAPDGES